jgi:SpoIID/LytB domain protein
LREENGKSDQAVNETAGQVLKKGNRLLPVVFSAQCGGHTQNYREQWGYDAPIVGVPDYGEDENKDMDFPLSPLQLETWVKENRKANCLQPELKGYRNYRWAAVVSAPDLGKKAPGIGRPRRLLVTSRSEAGWAELLRVEGEHGTKEVKGDYIRSFLGGIRSNLFWIETQFDGKGWPEEFVIYGGGWGHGVGLCQVGAYGLAKKGETCAQILYHYFPKAEIGAWNHK